MLGLCASGGDPGLGCGSKRGHASVDLADSVADADPSNKRAKCSEETASHLYVAYSD
jgi:hypothetical protein